MQKFTKYLVGLIIFFFTLVCCKALPPSKTNNMVNNNHLHNENLFIDIVSHPAFTGFGHLMIPSSILDLPISRAGEEAWHILETINFMIDKVYEGKEIFYDIYTDDEKKNNSTKSETGLFFFEGRQGAPFALIVPGGGFVFVNSITEGFPFAYELVRQGFNAFILSYRVNDLVDGNDLSNEFRATGEDMLAAMHFIFDNADKFNVDTSNYSVWGSSAGGWIIGNYTLESEWNHKIYDLPSPCVSILVYPAYPSNYNELTPPVFMIVGDEDAHIIPYIKNEYLPKMYDANVDVEYKEFPGMGHGFGLGIGTIAEGWFDEAILFWNKYRKQ